MIDAELRPGVSEGGPAKTRVERTLAERGLQAELRWTEHIPRTGGKTRRLRPLDERDAVMKQTSMLKVEVAHG